MRRREFERAGDIAWAAIISTALVYEFTFQDLLSMATERWVRKHPILARLPILAVAGHLACVLPKQVDVFNADNSIHAAIVNWAQKKPGHKAFRPASRLSLRHAATIS